MSPELALQRPRSMSAVWSLSGVKRTSQFKNGTSVCDPQQKSRLLAGPDYLRTIFLKLQPDIVLNLSK
jgi:hypothetical protein